MPLTSMSRRRAAAPWHLAVAALCLWLGAAPPAAAQDPALSAEQAARFAGQAEAWRRQLTEQVMPFWYGTVNREVGGYQLPETENGERQLVSQARLLWGFSHAWLHGIRDPERDYLAAARHGYRFLIDNLRDPEHGGFYWMISRGRVVDQRKLLYGQAFVIHALVEYSRASGDAEPLRQAAELFRLVDGKGRDPQHGGWYEHFERDWLPILEPDAGVPTGMAGMKSGNTMVHWMEALTELHRGGGGASVEGGRKVEDALAEALDLSLEQFYPAAPGQSYPYRAADWQRPLGPSFKQIFYGHNVEFAWLMLDVQAALSRDPLWDRFDAILTHALAHGFDHERGGLYGGGFGDRPALITEKIWWVQAEMLAALTTAVRHRADAERVAALDRLIGFLTTYQIDPKDGIWFDTVKADGAPWRPRKAGAWKVNYHDVRAMLKFIEAFGPDREAPRG